MMESIYIDTALHIRGLRDHIRRQQRFLDENEAALDRMERDGKVSAKLMEQREFLSTPQEDRDAVEVSDGN